MITDANIERFWTAYTAGRVVWTRDLLAENPAIAEEVQFGSFDVSVVEMDWDGTRVFVAHADDGFDGRDAEDENDFVRICSTEAEASEVARSYIADWHRAWDMED